ncbi:MAG: LPXTG cell wall anchor domain-containing protein, partial [Actinomycetota bacterium]
QDADEPGINGAKVLLKDADGNVIATATTAKGAWDGFYSFFLDSEDDDLPGTFTAVLDTTSVSGELTTAGAFTITITEENPVFLDADFGVAEELPKTGMNVESLALLGLALLAAGLVAILFTRRRREDL